MMILTSALGMMASLLQGAPFPESEVTAPLDVPVSSRINYHLFDRARGGSYDYTVTLNELNQSVVGFSFSNLGTNRVVPKPAEIGEGPQRDWSFEFDERARQDIQLQVTDVPNSNLSQLMESYFYFFPRVNLPAIQWPAPDSPEQGVFTVVLPTGEKVLFNTQSKEVVSGVLTETRPIDLRADRFSRQFAGIKYSGTGVMIRVDKRGADPRLKNTALISKGAKTCKVPTTELFNQDVTSRVEFIFPTDGEFNEFLKKRCQIQL